MGCQTGLPTTLTSSACCSRNSKATSNLHSSNSRNRLRAEHTRQPWGHRYAPDYTPAMEQQRPTPRLVTAIRVLVVLALIPVVLHLWKQLLAPSPYGNWELIEIGNDVSR